MIRRHREQESVSLCLRINFKVDPETQGTRIGIPKGEDALTDRINEIIDEVVDQNLYNEWYDEYTEYAKSLGIIE